MDKKKSIKHGWKCQCPKCCWKAWQTGFHDWDAEQYRRKMREENESEINYANDNEELDFS